MIVIVCSALITKGDTALLVQESKMDKFGLPGGKLENGESLRQCVAREVREELGAEIKINRLVMVSEKPLTHEGNTVLRFIYEAEIVDIAATSELTYDYYNQGQVAEIVQNGKLRGKDVEQLLGDFFESRLQELPEPITFV